jgi:hypothetical protein
MKLQRVIVAATGVLLALAASAGEAPKSAVDYTDAGELKFPANYREWVFLSAGVGMTYGPARAFVQQDHPDIDNVFVNTDAYRYFLANGTWPDKTSLVLEIRNSETNGSINRGGFFQGDTLAIEVHVKDKRFEGDWAFFDFAGANRAAGKPFPKSASCFSCHEQHGAVDTTFVQFYPILQSVAKAKGTYKTDR